MGSYGVGSAQRQVFLPPPFATTPIVAALAHVKISDTLLTLLLILAADACLRAVAGGRLGWLLVAGVWMGTRVPNQDGAGGGRPPSTRSCVSPCRARPAATALRSCCARRRGHSRCVYVLDRHGPADTRLGTAQCGRFAGQIAARDGVRVQPLSRYGVGSDTTPGFGEPGGNGARCRLCWPTRWRRRSGCFADLSSPGLQESSGVGHSTPIRGYSFELLPVLGEGATQRQQRNRSKCRFPIRTGYISAISPLPPRLLGAVQRTE